MTLNKPKQTAYFIRLCILYTVALSKKITCN